MNGIYRKQINSNDLYGSAVRSSQYNSPNIYPTPTTINHIMVNMVNESKDEKDENDEKQPNLSNLPNDNDVLSNGSDYRLHTHLLGNNENNLNYRSYSYDHIKRPYYKKCDSSSSWTLHYNVRTQQWIFDSRGFAQSDGIGDAACDSIFQF